MIPGNVPPGPLLVELVPATTWGNNLRTPERREKWNRWRAATAVRASFACEICGEKGNLQGFPHNVECHEAWAFDEAACVQRLVGLVALCPRCHRVKHAGRTIEVDGEPGRNEVLGRLVRVNGWTPAQAKAHLHGAFTLWRQRSREPWRVDLSWVDGY